MLSNPPTLPFRTDSLAARVIVFFQNNTEKEMDLEAIVEKFDVSRGNIHTQLSKPLEMDLLVRERNLDGDYIYKIGPKLYAHAKLFPGVNIDASTPMAAKTERQPKARPAAARVEVDIDAITVEDDVPYPGRQHKGKFKWQPLFEKLTKEGQSCSIPIEVRGAVGAAATKLNSENKTTGGPQFSVVKINDKVARVFRLKPSAAPVAIT